LLLNPQDRLLAAVRLTTHQMSHLNMASCAAVKLQNTQFDPLL